MRGVLIVVALAICFTWLASSLVPSPGEAGWLECVARCLEENEGKHYPEKCILKCAMCLAKDGFSCIGCGWCMGYNLGTLSYCIGVCTANPERYALSCWVLPDPPEIGPEFRVTNEGLEVDTVDVIAFYSYAGVTDSVEISLFIEGADADSILRIPDLGLGASWDFKVTPPDESSIQPGGQITVAAFCRTAVDSLGHGMATISIPWPTLEGVPSFSGWGVLVLLAVVTLVCVWALRYRRKAYVSM